MQKLEAEEPIKLKQEKPEVPKFNVYKKEEMELKINQMQQDLKNNNKDSLKSQLSIVSEDKIQIQESLIEESIQREVQFYQIGKKNAENMLKLLEKANINIKRPTDFFAEMFKSDNMMGKVKKQLIQSQAKIQEFEEKKNKLYSKKIHKKMKAATQEKKHGEKRRNVEAINEWKQEIKQKGEHGKDLSYFLMNKDKNKQANQQHGNGNKSQQFQHRGSRGNGGPKIQKFKTSSNSKRIQKDKKVNTLKNKKNINAKRPGKVARRVQRNKRGNQGSKHK